MWYVATEIGLWMLAAFLLGALVGWVFRMARAREFVSREREDLVSAFEQEEQRASAAEGRAAAMEVRLAELARQVQQRQDKIDALERDLSTQHVTVKGLEAARDQLRDKVADRERAARALEDCVADSDRRREEEQQRAQRELERVRAEAEGCQREVQRLGARIAELEPMAARREAGAGEAVRPAREPREPSPAPTVAATASMRDDLKRIKGVGPVIERRLNELGYHTFGDIAGWTATDIERVREALGPLGGRIRRERWVEQAKRFGRGGG